MIGYEFNLSTAFDISTANYAGNKERFYVRTNNMLLELNLMMMGTKCI